MKFESPSNIIVQRSALFHFLIALPLQLPQVDPAAYQLLLDCIESNDINVCEQVPSGVESEGRKLVDPLGGGGHQVDGADRYV